MRVWISAGETSGDRLGALLVDALRMRGANLEFAGLAGPALRAAGVEPAGGDPSRFALAGWSSVLRDLPGLLVAGMRILREARRNRPDLVVLVDSPGLHRPLLRALRRDGIRCVWLAPPQLWAWRSRSVPELRGLDVYPLHAFEVERLRVEGAQPHWFGFPGPRGEGRSQPPGDILALLPGSRTSWRRMHLGLFLEAANLAGLPLGTVVAVPDDRTTGPGEMPIGHVLSRAALALAMPGTGVLETSLAGIPTVVAARPGRLDRWIATRSLVDGPLSLTNRILSEEVCPEFLGAPTAQDLATALRSLWSRRDEVSVRLERLRGTLGPPDAVDRIAEHLLRTPRDVTIARSEVD
jgi:lipid-A-disaccharide synthase